MREEGVYLTLFILLLWFHVSNCIPLVDLQGSALLETKGTPFLPVHPPSGEPKPFLPSLAPSPLSPFTNKSVPRLSGLCKLNFSDADSMLRMTAVDCWDFFAPLLANVICCPQLEATLAILIGRSSKDTSMLALDEVNSKNCLSDVEQMLRGQGASDNLQQICSISPSNLTEASCPVKEVAEFEKIVDSAKLLDACEKIDPVNECCTQICQNAIMDAARNISLKEYSLSSGDGPSVYPEQSEKVDDCKIIVVRWLTSRLEPSSAKKVLRVLSNCNVNKGHTNVISLCVTSVCPLVFPGIKNVAKDCGNEISNQTACCSAMDSYVSHLQKQSFITNLQALDCAALLGMKLHKSNITRNVYSLCHITLKDFSLQVGSQESGCLLPSLPSDATYDQSSGISFLCDLNDNIAAPWPSTSQQPSSSCNKVKLPALPAATSAQSGRYGKYLMLPLLFSVLFLS